MMFHRVWLLLACVAALGGSWRAAVGEDLVLRYDRPAGGWNEALPIGNGRLGAMVFGGVESERLQLNEATLYTGYPGYRDLKLSVAADYPRVTQLIRERKFAEANAIIQAGWRGKTPAFYEPLGDLLVDFDHREAATNYRRSLDLGEAVCRIGYDVGGTHFSREIFASYPDQVIVMRLGVSRPGALNFRVRTTSVHPVKVQVVGEAGSELVMTGEIPGFVVPAWFKLEAIEKSKETWKFPEFWDEKGRRRVGAKKIQYNGRGIRFGTRMKVVSSGGRVVAEGQSVRVSGADSAVVVFSAGSSFNGFDKDPAKEGVDAGAKAGGFLRAAVARGAEGLWERHVRDYRGLFGRVSLELGTGSAMATDQRVREFGEGGDVSLAALHFQFGRYLMIAGSRPGSPAMNLTGLWSESVTPAWNGIPTLDVNLEMNYWPAEVANLSECARPLFEYIRELSVNGRGAASRMFGRKGWITFHQSSIWAECSPIIDASFASLWTMAPGWLCQNLFDHYAFSGDREFLGGVAYPIMKSACEFHLDGGLIEDAAGKLVTPVSTSPENRFKYVDASGQTQTAAFSAGCTMDLAILRELFGNTIQAAEILDVDAEFRAMLAEKLKRLAPYRIGARGQLQEWAEDFVELEPDHRHMSHLYPLHPGNQITRRGTPELAAAVARSLELRGDTLGGWSSAWKMSLYARLGDGENAWKAFNHVIRTSTMPNLFDQYPKNKAMQIDANFGACAGIAEMLVQSQSGEVELLAGLPKAWAAGKVSGLRARGGFEVAMEWREGKLNEARIKSLAGRRLRVRWGDRTWQGDLAVGAVLVLDGELKGVGR